MRWNEVKVENQRKLFVEVYLASKLGMTELCQQYNISRPTGYKWVERYLKEGESGLLNLSRAPHTHATVITEEVIDLIIHVRCRFPKWGQKKILPWLKEHYKDIQWPSLSTIGSILSNNGLISSRKKRIRVSAKTMPFADCNDFNDTWSVDFKGWWLTQKNEKYEPFTLTDAVSRFILRALHLKRKDTEHVWGVIENAFREYGLPKAIRSDNGPPFGSMGIGRLSPLAIKLIKSGVIPEWIDPGKPQQNGRHERMHGTMKSEVAKQPAENMVKQDMDVLEFRQYFNFERPHEALGQVTPGSIYQPSNRIWKGKFLSPEYSELLSTRQVCAGGFIKWKGQKTYLSSALAGEPVGFEEIDTDMWVVYYGPIVLGLIDHNKEFHRPESLQRKKSWKEKE